MKFTEEQLKKMNSAKTAEELIAIAKAEGIEATEEQIRAQFDAMHKEGEIADDELDNVAGGCGEHTIETHVFCRNPHCSQKGSTQIFEGDRRDITRCPKCGREADVWVYDLTDQTNLWQNF